MRASTSWLWALVLLPAVAWPCDRALSVFEQEKPLALAAADHVVLAKVTALEPAAKGKELTRAIVEVKTVLKTTAALKPGQRLEITGLAPQPVVRMCGGTLVEPGKEYVFLVWNPAVAGSTAYDVLDGWAGVQPGASADTWSKLKPSTGVSPWLRGADGIATRLMQLAPKGQVFDLAVLMRNTTAKPATFSYADWPEATQTRCTLSVVEVASGKPVEPKPSPIARKDIEDYFSKHGRRYSHALPPGGTHVHRLSRVTDAAQGWGYKEDLGFRYWPLSGKGEHEVSVSCDRFFGAESRTQTAAVRVLP